MNWWSDLPQPWSTIILLAIAAYGIYEFYSKYQKSKNDYNETPDRMATNNLVVTSRAFAFVVPLAAVIVIATLLQPKYGQSIWFYILFPLIGGMIVLFGAYYFWKRHYKEMKVLERMK